MKRSLTTIFLLACYSFAQAESAELRIEVVQLYSEKVGKRPFSEVGFFELRRGDAKFEGATCPDTSNKEGKLTCKLVCSAKDRDAIRLKVIPPRPQIAKGYTVPPADEVTITGCKLLPDTKQFVYSDSRKLLVEILQETPSLADISQKEGDFVVKPFTVNTAPKLVELSKQPASLQKLDRIRVYMGDLAIQSQGDGNSEAAKRYAEYSYGASNAILHKVYGNLGSGSQQILTTGSKADFYKNLGTIKVELDKKPNKSEQDLGLSSTVTTLRTSPSSHVPNVSLIEFAK